MPQNNYFNAPAVTKSALNITAPKVIKAGGGRIGRISVNAPGATSGAWTINDCATLAAATAANVVWSMAYNATANVAGAAIDIDFPCQNGIVLSAVPGGTPNAALSFR